MKRRLALPLLVIAGVAVTAASCKKKPENSPIPCYLLVFPDGAPAGGMVDWNGKRIGYGIETGDRYKDDFMATVAGNKPVPVEHPISLVCLTDDTWLSTGGALALERKTPCGDRSVPITLRDPLTKETEEKAREELRQDTHRMLTLFVDMKDPGAPLASTGVWYVPASSPLPADVKISIGQAQLTLPKGYNPKGVGVDPTMVFGLDCQAQHAVKVDDREVGTLTISEGAPRGLIINDRGVCLRLSSVRYKALSDVSPGGGGWDTHLKGPLSVLQKISRIDHFLEEAPPSQSDGAALTELVEEPCKDDGPADPKKGLPGPGKKGNPGGR